MADAAARYGDAVAYRSGVGTGDQQLSFGELAAAAARGASQLQMLDIDNVVVADGGSIALPIAIFASVGASVPVAPVDPSLHPDDQRHLLESLDLPLLIGGDDARQAISGLPDVASALLQEFVGGIGSALARDEPEMASTPTVAPDLAEVLLQLVRRSPEGMGVKPFAGSCLDDALRFNEAMAPLRAPGLTLVARESHDAATVVALLRSLHTGEPVSVTPDRGRALHRRLVETGVTHLEISSDRLPGLVRAAQRGDITELASVVVGDAPLPPALLFEAAEALDVDVETAFGLVDFGIGVLQSSVSEMGGLDRLRPGERLSLIHI